MKNAKTKLLLKPLKLPLLQVLHKLKAKLLLNNPKKLKHKNDTERLFLYRNNCVEV